MSMIVKARCAGLGGSGIMMPPTKYWEIVAGKLSAAGWSWAIAASSRETVAGCLHLK
jgi:hypothetical protein